MTPTPSPTPVDVFVHSGPAEWWQILAALGPLAVLLGAGIAGYIGWRTLKQKAVADNRAEWWKRTQWALDAVYSGDKKRGTVGLKVLRVLGESELAGPGELAVLEAAWETPLNEAERVLEARLTVATQAAKSASAERADTGDSARSASTGRVLRVTAGSIGTARERTVDGEPGPRDNGEEDQPGTTEGGAR